MDVMFINGYKDNVNNIYKYIWNTDYFDYICNINYITFIL